MEYKHIILDGCEYKVRLVHGSLRRSFQILEGQNSGVSIDGTEIRDIIGTKVSYTVRIEPDPAHMFDYQSFWWTVTEPVEYHHVKLPLQQITAEFDCIITGGEDTFMGVFNNDERYNGLELTFTPLTPQRKP